MYSVLVRNTNKYLMPSALFAPFFLESASRGLEKTHVLDCASAGTKNCQRVIIIIRLASVHYVVLCYILSDKMLLSTETGNWSTL